MPPTAVSASFLHSLAFISFFYRARCVLKRNKDKETGLRTPHVFVSFGTLQAERAPVPRNRKKRGGKCSVTRKPREAQQNPKETDLELGIALCGAARGGSGGGGGRWRSHGTGNDRESGGGRRCRTHGILITSERGGEARVGKGAFFFEPLWLVKRGSPCSRAASGPPLSRWIRAGFGCPAVYGVCEIPANRQSTVRRINAEAHGTASSYSARR